MVFTISVRGLVVATVMALTLYCASLYWSFITDVHGGFRSAAYLFPVAVYISPETQALTPFAWLVAFAQWPVYMALVLVAWRYRKRYWSAVIIGFLITQHLIIGQLAFQKVDNLPVHFKLERTVSQADGS
jgi:hypothetical protein